MGHDGESGEKRERERETRERVYTHTIYICECIDMGFASSCWRAGQTAVQLSLPLARVIVIQ